MDVIASDLVAEGGIVLHEDPGRCTVFLLPGHTHVLKLCDAENDESWSCIASNYAVLGEHFMPVRHLHNSLIIGAVMPMRGKSTAQFLPVGRHVLIRPSEFFEIAVGVAAEIKRLNELGLHHGDISSGNIVFNHSGEVSLIDADRFTPTDFSFVPRGGWISRTKRLHRGHLPMMSLQGIFGMDGWDDVAGDAFALGATLLGFIIDIYRTEIGKMNSGAEVGELLRAYAELYGSPPRGGDVWGMLEMVEGPVELDTLNQDSVVPERVHEALDTNVDWSTKNIKDALDMLMRLLSHEPHVREETVYALAERKSVTHKSVDRSPPSPSKVHISLRHLAGEVKRDLMSKPFVAHTSRERQILACSIMFGCGIAEDLLGMDTFVAVFHALRHPSLIGVTVLEAATALFQIISGLFSPLHDDMATKVDSTECFRRIMAAHEFFVGGGDPEDVSGVTKWMAQDRCLEAGLHYSADDVFIACGGRVLDLDDLPRLGCIVDHLHPESEVVSVVCGPAMYALLEVIGSDVWLRGDRWEIESCFASWMAEYI